jgi:hypothetical protein
MRLRLPSRNVCERFHLTYELQGAQKGANVLTSYYRVRKMKVVVDGRRVSKGYLAEYLRNRAYFKRREIRKRLVLHELYHHLVEAKGLVMPLRKEEYLADEFARKVVRRKA